MCIANCIDQAFVAHLAAPPSVQLAESMPILYFGNLEAYRRSAKRIITVAVNPSFAEFPTDDPWVRFPNGRRFWTHPPTVSADRAAYRNELDNYFEVAPSGWFKRGFEAALAGFDASYWGTATNRVLHTDLLTPIATKEQYSNREMEQHHANLEKVGVPLWHSLIDLLEPHIAVISLNRKYLKTVAGTTLGSWVPIPGFKDKKWGAAGRDYDMEHQVMKLDSGWKMDVLYCPQWQESPLSSLTNGEKAKLASCCAGKLTHF